MKKYSYILASLVVILMFAKLTVNYQNRYGHDDEALVLEECIDDSARIVKAITDKNYLPTEEDAAFAAHHLKSVSKIGEGLTSLYDLNKNAWRIPSELIDKSGSAYYRQTLANERISMGLDADFYAQRHESLKSVNTIDNKHSGSITVNVSSISEDAGTVSKLIGKNKKPCSGVTVRLYEHYISPESVPASRIMAYAKTDASGKAVFKGLDKSLSYSVIPIREGYEYGSSRGTVEGSLKASSEDGALECNFIENTHKIKVFNTATLKNIKSDHHIVLRSLKSYFMTMLIYMGVFFLIWWLFIFIYKRRNPGADCGVLSIIMTLTGICLLMMFSMNDPLDDKIIGVDMAQGVIAGVIVMILMQSVNFTRFYQGKSRLPFDIPAAFIKLLCKPLGLYKKADALFERLPKGFGYMLTALVLTFLLFTPLGVAIGGMRVNLDIGVVFQPSEIAKYLIVIFIAAFFCVNADKIVKFSDKGNVDLFGSKMKMLGAILLGLIFLMGLYLLLGDMGPAMVLSFTFIIMYSIIKSKVNLEGLSEKDELKHILTCDLAMLIYGVLSFIGMLYVGKVIGLMWLTCLGWFAIWIVFGLLKKRVFESAIVFNLIIAAFIFGATIMGAIPGLDSVAERLDSRNEMCTNTWGTLPIDGQAADPGENTQVAEGLWGLASGGLLGQGIGEGTPSFIPAFHTDMILSSVGEQLGFVGLMLIVILLVMLLRKTILHGYRTAHPFAFYLCMGIAVVTGVQFIIITLGSTGIIPLTGVTVPFFSFGKVSMILNLAAFGIVLSIAGRNAHPSDVPAEVQQIRKEQMQKYDYSIALLSLIFSAVALFILGVYLNYQVIQRDETLIRPVYVNNTEGYPVVNYNPRIEKIADEMPIGNIYDRNGVLLATSNVDELITLKERYLGYGIDSSYLDSHLKQRLRRYYPFGNHLFYMIGDYNTRLFFTSGDMRGYLAEARHLSDLRGYDDRMSNNGEYVKVDLRSDNYKPGRYFGSDSTLLINGLQLRDYTALLPALKSGKPVGTAPKEVRLTLDARLQHLIQNELEKFVQNDNNRYTWKNPVTSVRSYRKYKDTENLRISVVVMDAINGDLLTSALYPLPDQDRLMSMSDKDLANYSDISKGKDWRAYSDMDLGLLYPSQPGSTGKVLTSMAALTSNDLTTSQIRNLKYFNYSEEQVGYEYPANLNKDMSMFEALKLSSNNYFIKLLNDKDLYDELAKVYSFIGARLGYEQTYSLFYEEEVDESMSTVMSDLSKYAVSTYDNYVEKVSKTDKYGKPVNQRYPLDKHAAWQLAWGQGRLTATPLAMARVASIVAGDGKMPFTRFDLDAKPSRISLEGMSRDDIAYLKSAMKAEGDSHVFGSTVYGKTGTAQRSIGETAAKKSVNEQDGWYMGYCEGCDGPIAFVVRMERGPGSGNAVRVTNDVILPALRKMGYIK